MLTITIGCPGAGKSTWAETNVHPYALRLERDRFREGIFGSRRNYHTNGYDRNHKSTVITQAMMAAMMYWPTPEWAVTDTGLYWKSVVPFIDHAMRVCAPIKLFVFERDPKLLVERNIAREPAHQVPADILIQCIDKFNDPEAWWRKGDYERVYV